MNRADALRLWERIAAGDLEQEPDDLERDDLHLWIREIAGALVLADSVDVKVRPGEIVRAVGLLGRNDLDADLRNAIEMIDEFSCIGDGGVEQEPPHGKVTSVLVSMARLLRPDWFELTDEEVKKRIKRIRLNSQEG